MISKEVILEHLKSSRGNLELAEKMGDEELIEKFTKHINQYEKILKDLEVLDYYEKIKLMLKQKGCVLRYIESEDCFAVRCILDEKWYKLSKSLVEDNIAEEIEPSPLIDKVKKQKKILEILKENAHLYVNDINKEVKSIQINITTCDDNFNKVEEWLDNER